MTILCAMKLKGSTNSTEISIFFITALSFLVWGDGSGRERGGSLQCSNLESGDMLSHIPRTYFSTHHH